MIGRDPFKEARAAKMISWLALAVSALALLAAVLR